MTNLELIRTSLSYLRQRLVGKRLAAMLFAVGLMVLAGWLANLPAILLGEAVDLIVQGDAETFRLIFPTLQLIAAVIVSKELVQWCRKFIIEKAATALEREEFLRIIRRLLRLDLSLVSRERVGTLNKRIDRSVEGVIRLIKLVFLDFLPTVVVAGVAIYLAMVRNWSIAGVMLGVALAGAGLTLWQVRSQKGIRIALFRAKEEISGNVVELLQGIEYVRASGAVHEEVAKANKIASEVREKEFRHHKFMMSFDALKQLAEGAGFVIVIAASAWLASRGSVSEGEVLTFAVLFSSVAMPIRELHRIVDEGFEAMLRIEDLFSIYRLPVDRGLDGCERPDLDTVGLEAVSCENVSVEYPTQDGCAKRALHGISVAIERGETIGVAGASGSGKSTFARLLLGLVPGYMGSAKLFGTEIRAMDKDLLASLVSYVPQVPFLVHGSVTDNILYGLEREGVEGSEMWRALEKAQVEGVVRGMAGELNAPITEQGRNLSGGERQRLVLARVFLKGAEFLVLDEATAALDPPVLFITRPAVL